MKFKNINSIFKNLHICVHFVELLVSIFRCLQYTPTRLLHKGCKLLCNTQLEKWFQLSTFTTWSKAPTELGSHPTPETER